MALIVLKPSLILCISREIQLRSWEPHHQLKRGPVNSCFWLAFPLLVWCPDT